MSLTIGSVSKKNDGNELKTSDDFFIQLHNKFPDSAIWNNINSKFNSYYFNFDSIQSRQNVVIEISTESKINEEHYIYKTSVSFDYLEDCSFDNYNNYKDIILYDDNKNEIKAFITYHFWRTI